MHYSKEAKIEIIFIYDKTQQCLRESVQSYKERFPISNCPSHSIYTNIIKTFHENGSMSDKHEERKTIAHETNH